MHRRLTLGAIALLGSVFACSRGDSLAGTWGAQGMTLTITESSGTYVVKASNPAGMVNGTFSGDRDGNRIKLGPPFGDMTYLPDTKELLWVGLTFDKVPEGKEVTVQKIDVVSGSLAGWRVTVSRASDPYSTDELAKLMESHAAQLGECVAKSESASAAIDLMVNRDGRLAHLRVNGETSSPLASCLSQAFDSIVLPAPGQDRARISLEVSR